MKFRGCGVALITPFNADKSVDFAALKTIISNNIEGGVDYFVVLGTTAETPTLTNSEKKEIVDFCKKEINGAKPLVVGFSGNNTMAMVEEMNQFDFEGVDGVLCASPYYNKPSQEGIYEHYSNISKACPVPIILYNIPGRTSSNMNIDTILRLAKDFDNIVAIKEASGNMTQIMNLIAKTKEDFLVISGDDSLTLPLISVGGDGVISVLANGLPSKMSKLTNSALDNDFETAKKVHNELLALFMCMAQEGNPTGIKSLLNITGVTKNNLRLPLMRASSELSSEINKLLNNLSK